MYRLLTSSDTICPFASSSRFSCFCLAIRFEVSMLATGIFSNSGVKKVIKMWKDLPGIDQTGCTGVLSLCTLASRYNHAGFAPVFCSFRSFFPK